VPEGYRRLPKVVIQAGDGYRRFDCGVSVLVRCELPNGSNGEALTIEVFGLNRFELL